MKRKTILLAQENVALPKGTTESIQETGIIVPLGGIPETRVGIGDDVLGLVIGIIEDLIILLIGAIDMMIEIIEDLQDTLDRQMLIEGVVEFHLHLLKELGQNLHRPLLL